MNSTFFGSSWEIMHLVNDLWAFLLEQRPQILKSSMAGMGPIIVNALCEKKTPANKKGLLRTWDDGGGLAKFKKDQNT